MQALITGATGFIGSRLVLRCLDEGIAVRALGRRNSPVEQENAGELERRGSEIEEVPVDDRTRLADAMTGVDVVFHLAAAQHEANVPDEYFRAINVEGTRNVLDAAETAGVGRVVYGSTIGIYAWRPGHSVGEDSPQEPENIYGVTKLEAEQVVRSYAGRVPFAIARISETYGPGDRRLLKLFKGAERGLSLQIGDGENLHHLVYVDDLISGLLLAAREERAVGRTFVLAGREPVTTRAMLEAVARSIGRPPRIVRLPLAPLMLTAAVLEGVLRPLGIQPPLHRRRMDFFRKSFAFSLEEAGAVGYDPRVDLDEGMRATARWYLERGLVSADLAIDTPAT
jgi:nucleoside-diphosphate-sugar epimerase